MSQQQDLPIPGIRVTVADAHAAIRSVIAAAASSAAAHGSLVVMAIGVGARSSDPKRPWVFGAGAHTNNTDPRQLVFAAAAAHGACLTLYDAFGQRESDIGFEWAKTHAHQLFDHEKAHVEDVDATRVCGAAEAELARVLTWLRAHEDLTPEAQLLALEARDHRRLGQGGDADTDALERRVDILDAIHRHTPLPISAVDLAEELEDQPHVRADLQALWDADIVRPVDVTLPLEWVLAPDLEERLVDAGMRAMAALAGGQR